MLKKIPSYLIFFPVVVYFFRFFIPPSNTVGYVSVLFLGLLFLFFIKVTYTRFLLLFIFSFFFIFNAIFNGFFNEVFTVISGVLIVISNLLFAFYLNDNRTNLNISFLSKLLIVICLTMLLTTLLNFKNGYLPDYITFLNWEVNKNHIKVLAGFISFVSFFIVRERYKRRSYIIIFISVLLLIINGSRAGLLTGIFIFFSLMLVFMESTSLKMKYKVGIVFFCSVITLITLFNSKLEILELQSVSRFQSSSIDSPRLLVNKCYIENFQAEQFVLGLNSNKSYLCAYLSGVGRPDPHNSFINGLGYYGVIYYFFILLYLVVFMMSIVDLKKFFFHASFLSIILTESFITPSSLDYIVLYILLREVNKSFKLIK